MFFLAGTYRAILFGEQFIEPFDEQSKGFPEEVNSMNLEVNWNWTLFAKKGFQIIIHNLWIINNDEVIQGEIQWF